MIEQIYKTLADIYKTSADSDEIWSVINIIKNLIIFFFTLK